VFARESSRFRIDQVGPDSEVATNGLVTGKVAAALIPPGSLEVNGNRGVAAAQEPFERTMDELDDASPLHTIDAEIKELLGLFDVPAFARRGQDVEYALARLRARCRAERSMLLEMVRLRLKQWAASATGLETERDYFDASIAGLWPLADAEPPRWNLRPASRWGLRGIARDLASSVERFNRRWNAFVDAIDLGPYNDQVDRYNRYYLLEKECVLGSARLASRHFTPRPRLTLDDLRAAFPPLPQPTPRRSSGAGKRF
jgi:hypothetical protein